MAKKAIVNASKVAMLKKELVEAIYKVMEKFDADTCVVHVADDTYAEVDLLKGDNCVEWAYPIVLKKES